MKEIKIPRQKGPHISINMMKCPKHGWFHGGSTGWICPRCNPRGSVTKVNAK